MALVNEVVPALLTNCYRSSRFCMCAEGKGDAIHLFNNSLAGFLNMIGVNQQLGLLLPTGLGCSPSWLFILSHEQCWFCFFQVEIILECFLAFAIA